MQEAAADRQHVVAPMTNPQALRCVQTWMEAIVTGRNPTDPFAAKPEIGERLRAALRAAR
jgi:hypothetical protein